MPFNSLMFANNCCIFAVQKDGVSFFKWLKPPFLIALVVQWIE